MPRKQGKAAPESNDPIPQHDNSRSCLLRIDYLIEDE